MKHLLKITDLEEKDIITILDLADQLKYEKKNNLQKKHLEGKSLGMVFEKSSTRTRISFEVGMYELGGHALFLSNRDLQMGRGESIKDTARVLSRYLDCVMIRTYGQEILDEFAKYSSVPVINALSDLEHPMQALADFMTIREYKDSFNKLKLCYIGDGNNMANSLIAMGSRTGMAVSIACPKGYEPNKEIMEEAKEKGNFLCTTDVLEAAKDADILYTDVWASMGQEEETNLRKEVFKNYQINHKVMAVAKKDAMVLHCLPAHKEEEISEDVFEEHAKYIFEQAENRLHVQKAVMVLLMKDRV